MILLKLLNPFIYIINFFNYICHLEMYRNCEHYDYYDFSKDLRYF